MPINKRSTDLNEVLTSYASASQTFDATVLQAFREAYPEHARALQRYAQVQLTFVPATTAEVDAEVLSDEELLPMQRRLLKRLRELRGTSDEEPADYAPPG